jgi:hypothetical protein
VYQCEETQAQMEKLMQEFAEQFRKYFGLILPEYLQAEFPVDGEGFILRNKCQSIRESLPDDHPVKGILMFHARQSMKSRCLFFGNLQDVESVLAGKKRELIRGHAA